MSGPFLKAIEDLRGQFAGLNGVHHVLLQGHQRYYLTGKELWERDIRSAERGRYFDPNCEDRLGTPSPLQCWFSLPQPTDKADQVWADSVAAEMMRRSRPSPADAEWETWPGGQAPLPGGRERIIYDQSMLTHDPEPVRLFRRHVFFGDDSRFSEFCRVATTAAQIVWSLGPDREKFLPEFWERDKFDPGDEGEEFPTPVQYWALGVHRLAWQKVVRSPLRADHWVWDDDQSFRCDHEQEIQEARRPLGLPEYETEQGRLRREERNRKRRERFPQPLDFFYSKLDQLGQCSVWAIDLIAEQVRRGVVTSAPQAGPPTLDTTNTIKQDKARNASEATPVKSPDTPAVISDTSGGRPKNERRTVNEANVLVRDHLAKHPNMGQRDTAKAIGVSKGAVGNTPAWKARQEEKRAARPPGRNVKSRSLTPEMLAVIPGDDRDPGEIVSEEERFAIAESKYVDTLDAHEKSKYWSLPKDKRLDRLGTFITDDPPV